MVGALPRCNGEMKPQRWFLLWYTYGKAGGGGVVVGGMIMEDVKNVPCH